MATTKKGIYYPTDYTKPADVPDDMKKLAESVDEAIGNIPQYDDTGIKKDISDLKKEQSTQKQQISDNSKKNTQQDTEISKLQTRIQQLQANMINETTDEATSLHVTNAAELPARLEVRGNHKQDGTPTIETPVEIQAVGDNINYFNKDSATQGKYLNYQNQEIENPAWTYSDYIPCKPNENWIISGYSIIGGAPARCFYDKNKSFLSGGAHNNQESMMKFTTLDNCYFFRESIAKADIDTVKIEKGDIATAYSPYNQGSTKITKTNSNVMPIVSLGTDWEYTENGIKNLAGNAGKRIFIIDVKKGQTIKFGLKLFSKPSVTTSFTLYVDMQENTNLNFAGIHSYNLNQVYTRTYTATEDCQIRSVMWGNANSETFEFQLWANIEEQKDYVRYAGEEYVLPIQQPMLLGDYFEKETDGWKEVHKYEKVNLSELDWQISANELQEKTFDFVVMYSNSNLSSDEKNCFCNCFNSETANFVYATDEEGIAQSKSQIMVRISKTKVTDVTSFKNLLAEKGAYAYIQSQNQTELDLTEQQKQVLQQLNELLMFKGTNNIITAEDLALMQLTYTVDTKSYIDSKIANTNAQLLNS